MTNERRQYPKPELVARARELRQPMTPAEEKLRKHLRGHQLAGFKFRRQHPVERFILDFCCEACKLVVEVDGESHSERQEYDAERTLWLNTLNYKVIPFSNAEILHSTEAVIETILAECRTRKNIVR